MKKYILILSGILMIGLSACKQYGASSNVETEIETETIVIPENYFDFINSTPEDTAKSYANYCTSTEVQGGDVIIEVTDSQRVYLIEENQKFIDGIVEEFISANSEYSCEMNADYDSIVFAYDEKIAPSLQGKVLSGVIYPYVLMGILDTGNSDWNVKITVKNCHNGNIVAEGSLPDGKLSFAEEEWEASYYE